MPGCYHIWEKKSAAYQLCFNPERKGKNELIKLVEIVKIITFDSRMLWQPCLIKNKKIKRKRGTLLTMLFESQSNPSYNPSPEVAHVLWIYLGKIICAHVNED